MHRRHHRHHHRHHWCPNPPDRQLPMCNPDNISDDAMLAEYQEMLHYFHKKQAWIDGKTGKAKTEFWAGSVGWQSDLDWSGIPSWDDYPSPPQPETSHCPIPGHHHHHHHHYNYSDYYAYVAWWMWYQWNFAPWYYTQDGLHTPNCPNVPMPEYNDSY